MAQDRKSPDSQDEIEINLKDPVLAGFWAWLWPGAGHIYQGRYAKAAVFMICILGTYFFGLALGGGHLVYFSWTETDKRLPYICQVGVGLPALPALVQMYRVIIQDEKPLLGGFMAPPHPVRPGDWDTKAEWCARYGFRWDMGELYTMVAGLLNVLAIFDAAAGPVLPPAEDEPEDKPPPEEQDPPKAGGK